MFHSSRFIFSLLFVVTICSSLRIPLKRNNNKKNHEDLEAFRDRHVQLLKHKYSTNTPGYLPLIDRSDVEYYGKISLGTPNQTFTLVFDTGSADLWVTSSMCRFWDVACWFHRKYNSKKSSTYEEDGRKFYIDYVSGSASGFLSRDKMIVLSLEVKNQTFAEINRPSMQFFLSPCDGIAGMAFPSIAVSKEKPFFVNMVQQRAIARPFFAFYLNKDKDNEEGGELTFGYTNRSHYEGKFTFVPIIKPASYWSFYLDSITVNFQDIGIDNATAIVDSGTSLIAGPPGQIKAINTAIGATYHLGLYFVDCDRIDSLPTVSFTINGTRFDLTGRDYVVEVTRFIFFKACVSGFMEVDLGRPIYILGNVFMRKVYTQFNTGHGLIGFAHTV